MHGRHQTYQFIQYNPVQDLILQLYELTDDQHQTYQSIQ